MMARIPSRGFAFAFPGFCVKVFHYHAYTMKHLCHHCLKFFNSYHPTQGPCPECADRYLANPPEPVIRKEPPIVAPFSLWTYSANAGRPTNTVYPNFPSLENIAGWNSFVAAMDNYPRFTQPYRPWYNVRFCIPNR